MEAKNIVALIGFLVLGPQLYYKHAKPYPEYGKIRVLLLIRRKRIFKIVSKQMLRNHILSWTVCGHQMNLTAYVSC